MQNPSQKTLLVSDDKSLFAYGFGGLFVFLGSGLCFMVLRVPLKTTYIFDKFSDRMELNQREFDSAISAPRRGAEMAQNRSSR